MGGQPAFTPVVPVPPVTPAKPPVVKPPPPKRPLYDPNRVFNRRRRLLAFLKRMKIYERQLTSAELDQIGRAGDPVVRMKDSAIRAIFVNIMRGRGATVSPLIDLDKKA